jgi:hypothetical protein
MKAILALALALLFSGAAYPFAQNNTTQVSGQQMYLRCHYAHTAAEVAIYVSWFTDCQLAEDPEPEFPFGYVDNHDFDQHAPNTAHVLTTLIIAVGKCDCNSYCWKSYLLATPKQGQTMLHTVETEWSGPHYSGCGPCD